ncbi:hypothetical protein MKK65_26560 [Methylobacterium sp. J-001]|uniref:hypothetical protein n=1 Tax=Methylobacterium sp. J-001 TaxID=2836609 RepID=UPI001FBA7351|nr:hypothetical protein [Methylobacterium sp. J-001]MCJ2120093.1 hypothetical protein [Methylobacterium sp. J-001]
MKIEEPEAPEEAASQLAVAPRWPRCADLAPELAAAYRLVVEVPAPPPAPLVPVIPEIIRWRPPIRRPDLRVVALEAAE